jgi:hypothetical protein
MATRYIIRNFFVDAVLVLCIVGALACALLLSIDPSSQAVLSASTEGSHQLESDLQQVTLIPIVSAISYAPSEQAVLLPDDTYSASADTVAATAGTNQQNTPFIGIALLATACYVVLHALNDLFDRIYRVGIPSRYYKR